MYGVMTELNPVYGERVKIDNVFINDVIIYKVKGIDVYSVVTGKTATMLKVFDLIVNDAVIWKIMYENIEINPTTKCYLSLNRKIYKVANVLRL